MVKQIEKELTDYFANECQNAKKILEENPDIIKVAFKTFANDDDPTDEYRIMQNSKDSEGFLVWNR